MKRVYLWTFLFVLSDQVTKYLIPGIRNTGGVFGVLPGWTWIFILLGIIVFVSLLFSLKHVEGYGRFAVVLLLAGIFGNLIDRVIFGYVRDFIDLKFWPVFNFADSYTTTGIILLLFYFWKEKKGKFFS